MKTKILAGVLALIVVANSMPALSFTGTDRVSKEFMSSVMVADAASAVDRVRDYTKDYWDNSYYKTGYEAITTPEGVEMTFGTISHGVIKAYRVTVNHTEIDEEGNENTITDKEEVVYGLDFSGLYNSTITSLDLSSAKPSSNLPTKINVGDEETVTVSSSNIGYVTGLDQLQYLKEVKLPSNLKYIPAGLFQGLKYITVIDIPKTVVGIGDSVFSGSGVKTVNVHCRLGAVPEGFCENTPLSLISFDYPKDVCSIGKNAFANTVITSYPLGDTTYDVIIDSGAFQGCSQLASLILPDTTEHIGESAFAECSTLKELKLGLNVKYVDAYAFSTCASLRSITLNPVLKYVGAGAFQNCTSLVTGPTFPSSVDFWSYDLDKYPEPSTDWDGSIETISCLTDHSCAGMFAGCTALKTVKLPANAKYIPSAMFDGCTQLTTVTLGDSIESIGNNAFRNCSNLQEVAMKEVSDMVGSGAFQNCTSLRNIACKKVNYIMNSAYQGCTALKKIDITISHLADNNIFEGCTAVTDANIYRDRTYGGFCWGSNVLANCDQLVSAYVDLAGTNFIPHGMFAGDERLTSLKTTDLSSVELVLSDAFHGCKSLKELALPKVVIVENSAFQDCTNLTKICSGAITIQDYGDNSFLNCKSLTQPVNAVVSTIGSNAFTGSAISNVNIVNTVGNTLVISDQAFSNCENLKSATIIIPDGVEYSIGEALFANDLALEKVSFNGTEVTTSMFENCSNIVSIELPKATAVRNNAFVNCTALQKLVRPTSTNEPNGKPFEYIGDSAFSGCSKLLYTYAGTGTTFEGSGQYVDCAALDNVRVYYLTPGMFERCTGLKTAILSANITEVPEAAFRDCTALTNPGFSAVKTFGSSSYENSGVTSLKITGANEICDSAFAKCLRLSNVDIDVVNIGNQAFDNCPSLTTATIVADRVGDGAFGNCGSLHTAKFVSQTGHSLIEIGAQAFSGTLLDTIVIPKTVTSLGYQCFGYGRNSEKSFVIYGTKGTAAQTYASDNDIEFKDVSLYNEKEILASRVLLGDVDMNGIVSIADAVKMQKWVLGDKEVTGIYGPNMDINKDGRVDSFDVVALRKLLISQMDYEEEE